MFKNTYRVMTRLEKKPDRCGRKLSRPWDLSVCDISCTGYHWKKPCADENYQNCDDCICNHCDDCKCEEERV